MKTTVMKKQSCCRAHIRKVLLEGIDMEDKPELVGKCLELLVEVVLHM